jgi:hypothetical protein
VLLVHVDPAAVLCISVRQIVGHFVALQTLFGALPMTNRTELVHSGDQLSDCGPATPIRPTGAFRTFPPARGPGADLARSVTVDRNFPQRAP